MKKARGFTLIELMVTLAVAAILISVAAPAFNTLIAGNRLTTLTNELVAGIHFTRGEAIKLNRSLRFCRAAAAGANDCAGAGGERWEHWVVSDGTTGLRSGSPGNRGNAFRVTSTLAGDRVDFRPDGLPTGSGQITVCTTENVSENRRIISIGPGNRVSVSRESGNCP